jgi:hypothetical protein
MLTVLATAFLPMCYIMVATDVGNPPAIVKHEMEHCWGMPGKHKPFQLAPGWKKRGPYPEQRVIIYFDTSRKVKIQCDDTHGCQWGGVKR